MRNGLCCTLLASENLCFQCFYIMPRWPTLWQRPVVFWGCWYHHLIWKWNGLERFPQSKEHVVVLRIFLFNLQKIVTIDHCFIFTFRSWITLWPSKKLNSNGRLESSPNFSQGFPGVAGSPRWISWECWEASKGWGCHEYQRHWICQLKHMLLGRGKSFMPFHRRISNQMMFEKERRQKHQFLRGVQTAHSCFCCQFSIHAGC